MAALKQKAGWSLYRFSSSALSCETVTRGTERQQCWRNHLKQATSVLRDPRSAALRWRRLDDAQLPGFETHWLRREPYTLDELSAFIPFGWRRPKVSRTAVVRNGDVFAHCMRWAGAPVLGEAHRINDGFKHPLDPPEVGGISRSVERYRRKWIKRGQFGAVGDAERTNWGRERGIRSGLARRKRTKGRDQAIVQAWLCGASIHTLSRLHGLRRYAVRHILERDAPLLRRGATN